MICAIHQPQYLPWIGYFDKMLRSDIFVLLDDVQYKKNEWQNRNKIRIPITEVRRQKSEVRRQRSEDRSQKTEGWQWLTVPVHYTFGQKINEILINNETNWGKKHLHSLVMNYSGASYFKDYRDFFEEVYALKWEYLWELNIHLIKNISAFLGLKTKLIKSSELQVERQKTERLVHICRELKADTYLSGKGAMEYLDLNLFKREKIRVIFQDFEHPVYPQMKWEKKNDFQPNMSVVDLLFNCGKESLKILQKCTKNTGA